MTLTGAGDERGDSALKSLTSRGNWTREPYGDTEADGIADKGSSKDIYVDGTAKYKVTLKESAI